jgi:hypothetical protein
MPAAKTDAEVIASHVTPGANGCLLWTGATNKGYGKLRRAETNKTWAAHRFAWTITNGPIPEGMVIDHLCRTPLCVNTDHMEVTTIRVNTIRGFSDSGKNARKLACKRGHDFTPDNTFPCNGEKPGRGCKACRRLWQRARNLGMKLDDYLEMYPDERDGLRVRAKPSGGPRRERGPRGPKTHCKHGHEFTEMNTYVKPSGERCCRECRRSYQASYQPDYRAQRRSTEERVA